MAELTDLQGLEVGQAWEHKNGNVYIIFDFINCESGRQNEYPTTVCYRNFYTGAKYGRAVSRWAGSFTRRPDLEKGEMKDFTVRGAFFDKDGNQVWSGKVTAASGKSALSWAKDEVLRYAPTAQFTWINVVGKPVTSFTVHEGFGNA